jgi:hypothetical protein
VSCFTCGRTQGVTLFGVGGRWICEICVRNLGPNPLTQERIKSLIVLCHPDRHQGRHERLATETTQWLLSMRQAKPRARKASKR